MSRYLADGEGHGFRAATLPLDKPGSHVDGNAALKSGKGKGRLSVTAIGGADQGEQSLVVSDGHQRAIAKRPACRGKVASEHPNFTYVRA